MLAIMQLDARVPAGLAGSLAAESGLKIDLLTPFRNSGLPEPADYCGIIVLGGYMGVHDVAEYPYLADVKLFLKKALQQNVPLLGICLGGQLLAEALGAPVFSQRRGEHGVCPLHVTEAGRQDPLLAGLGSEFLSFEWHNDSFDVPETALRLVETEECPGQAFRKGRAYGLQFHPEVTSEIVANWVAQSGQKPNCLSDFTRFRTEIEKAAGTLFRNFFYFCRASKNSTSK